MELSATLALLEIKSNFRRRTFVKDKKIIREKETT
jgi:hypothetical protein